MRRPLKVAAAAVDVLSMEPPAKDNPLPKHPKVIATPHIAASTAEAQEVVGVEIAEQVFDAPVRLGYPERDRFGGLIEDIQSPAWAAASGLCLIRQRAKSAEMRASAARAGAGGGIGALVSKFRNRFGSIF